MESASPNNTLEGTQRQTNHDAQTPRTKYTIICRDTITKRSDLFTSPNNPFEGTKLEDNVEGEAPVVEVFLEATGRREHSISASTFDAHDYQKDNPFDNEGGRNRGPGPKKGLKEDPPCEEEQTSTNPEHILAGFQLSSIQIIKIHIGSERLRNFLQSLVKYYPAQSLRGDPIVVYHPFRFLMHSYRALQNFASERPYDEEDRDFFESVCSVHEPSVECDEGTRRDLHILLKVLTPIYKTNIEKMKLRQDSGLVTFDSLWLLFLPGSIIYKRKRGHYEAFVTSNVLFPPSPPPRGPSGEIISRTGPMECTVQCWKIDFNGRRVRPVQGSHVIKRFEFEKEIAMLPILPASFFLSHDNGNIRKQLLERGKLWYGLIQRAPFHAMYSGPVKDISSSSKNRAVSPPRRPSDRHSANTRKGMSRYEGEVVIDHKSFLDNASFDAPDSQASDDDDDEEINPDNFGTGSYSMLPRNLRQFDPRTRTTLTPLEYIISPRFIGGYGLRTKLWGSFQAELISELRWSSSPEETMNRIILPSRDLHIIKALSQPYVSRGTALWNADFVTGKGEGQIFLLHGPPGTGKTYTVECVAEATRRPLLSLTVADIGTFEEDMESNLSKWFGLAAKWNAILLIDEADVFLEKRRAEAFQRNSLVSVLLRCMEYYKGMLFLTTNRIGHIDDAFLSRTSVALTYKTLDIKAQQKIWETFLTKLKKERRDIGVTYRATSFVTEGTEMGSIPWNGREIRNALQTAIALARHDADMLDPHPSKIEVDRDHFLIVLERRESFLQYRNSINNQDEDGRAFMEKSRAPQHKARHQ